MLSQEIRFVLRKVPQLQTGGLAVARGLHNAVLKGGSGVRRVADFLHGTWLGHPLHPVLTDATLGAWFMAAPFDLLGLVSGSARRAADQLTILGVITAVPTALAGMLDFSTIKRGAAGRGALHGLLNTVALVLYASSARARQQDRRFVGVMYSMLGLGVVSASAWLGGELVYRLRIGVNHTTAGREPQDWAAVGADAELAEGQALRVEVNGDPVLLYRHAGAIYATSAVCSHAGGPLDEGMFDGTCVQCPWHDSVFDLRSGEVVHGPATYHLPAYDVRTTDGQIEIRVRQETAQ